MFEVGDLSDYFMTVFKHAFDAVWVNGRPYVKVVNRENLQLLSVYAYPSFHLEYTTMATAEMQEYQDILHRNQSLFGLRLSGLALQPGIVL